MNKMLKRKVRAEKEAKFSLIMQTQRGEVTTHAGNTGSLPDFYPLQNRSLMPWKRTKKPCYPSTQMKMHFDWEIEKRFLYGQERD